MESASATSSLPFLPLGALALFPLVRIPFAQAVEAHERLFVFHVGLVGHDALAAVLARQPHRLRVQFRLCRGVPRGRHYAAACAKYQALMRRTSAACPS